MENNPSLKKKQKKTENGIATLLLKFNPFRLINLKFTSALSINLKNENKHFKSFTFPITSLVSFTLSIS